MIIRLVKLTFLPHKTAAFLDIFESSKNHIRAMEGCLHLELLRDEAASNVFFTLSHWVSEGHLNRYRQSDLFKKTWAATKLLFDEKPEAWTTKMVSGTGQ